MTVFVMHKVPLDLAPGLVNGDVRGVQLGLHVPTT